MILALIVIFIFGCWPTIIEFMGFTDFIFDYFENIIKIKYENEEEDINWVSKKNIWLKLIFKCIYIFFVDLSFVYLFFKLFVNKDDNED